MDLKTLTITEHPGGVRVIALHRPEARNALSILMRREISTALEAMRGDPKTAAVVFTGAGDAFCAGFDLKEFARPELGVEIFHSSARYHRDVWSFPKPTIAAVNGPALGGGLDLATLCDLRLCAATARFGHPEIKFGAPPLFTPLRWIVGHGLARDLCLTGRAIDAAEAHRIGLVSEVVAPAELLPRALATAATILAAPAATLSTTKAYMIGNASRDFEESFRAEHDDPFRAFLGPDA